MNRMEGGTKMPEESIEVLDARADSLVDHDTELLRSLAALRKKHGLTQAQVAERMMVSQPAVASFERYDANPTLATIRRYAMAVGARLRTEVIDDCEPERVSEDWGRAVSTTTFEQLFTQPTVTGDLVSLNRSFAINAGAWKPSDRSIAESVKVSR